MRQLCTLMAATALVSAAFAQDSNTYYIGGGIGEVHAQEHCASGPTTTLQGRLADNAQLSTLCKDGEQSYKFMLGLRRGSGMGMELGMVRSGTREILVGPPGGTGAGNLLSISDINFATTNTAGEATDIYNISGLPVLSPATLTDISSIESTLKWNAAYLSFTGRITLNSVVNLVPKIGAHYWQGEGSTVVRGTFANADTAITRTNRDDGSGLLYGMGLEVQLGDRLYLHADWLRFDLSANSLTSGIIIDPITTAPAANAGLSGLKVTNHRASDNDIGSHRFTGNIDSFAVSLIWLFY